MSERQYIQYVRPGAFIKGKEAWQCVLGLHSSQTVVTQPSADAAQLTISKLTTSALKETNLINTKGEKLLMVHVNKM